MKKVLCSYSSQLKRDAERLRVKLYLTKEKKLPYSKKDNFKSSIAKRRHDEYLKCFWQES